MVVLQISSLRQYGHETRDGDGTWDPLKPDPRQGDFTYDHWINAYPLNYPVRWAFSPFCRTGNGDYGGKLDSPKVTQTGLSQVWDSDL